MNKYRFTKTIEDEVYDETQYGAWAQFRNRVIERYYGPIAEQIELVEEGMEPTTSTPEES